MDHLSSHVSRATQAAWLAWPEVQLLWLPKSACGLNLIEPWWTQLRSLALKGHRFADVDELIEAVVQATVYWNAHRDLYVWKKAA